MKDIPLKILIVDSDKSSASLLGKVLENLTEIVIWVEIPQNDSVIS